jgi:hypothetical protein
MNGHPAKWASKNASGYNFYYRCVAHDGTIANLKCPLPQFRLELVDAAVWQWVTEFLTNPELLEQGMADYQTEQEVKNERVFERVAIIDELLADHQEQLNRILDLYLEGDFPKELLVEKKRRLEETIRALESEKLDLKDFIEKRSLTPEEYEDIQEFSRKISEGINLVSCDFETRKQVIELLDIQVVCMLDDDGNKFVNLKCILGSDQYHLSTNTHGQILGE